MHIRIIILIKSQENIWSWPFILKNVKLLRTQTDYLSCGFIQIPFGVDDHDVRYSQTEQHEFRIEVVPRFLVLLVCVRHDPLSVDQEYPLAIDLALLLQIEVSPINSSCASPDARRKAAAEQEVQQGRLAWTLRA